MTKSASQPRSIVSPPFTSLPNFCISISNSIHFPTKSPKSPLTHPTPANPTRTITEPSALARSTPLSQLHPSGFTGLCVAQVHPPLSLSPYRHCLSLDIYTLALSLALLIYSLNNTRVARTPREVATSVFPQAGVASRGDGDSVYYTCARRAGSRNSWRELA